MSETDELFASVNYIKNKVDTLEKIEILRMRADVELRGKYEEFLKGDPPMLAVYKAIDGAKMQKGIALEIGYNEMMVSRKIKKLEEAGLIELVSTNGLNKNIYIHTVVERAYRFVKNL